jgi:hypothetical protein
VGDDFGGIGFGEDFLAQGLSFSEERLALFGSAVPLQQGGEEGQMAGGLKVRAEERGAVDLEGFAEEAFGTGGVSQGEFGLGGEADGDGQVRMSGGLDGAAHIGGGAGQEQG